MRNLLIFLCCWSFAVSAQTDSVPLRSYLLQEVAIEGQRSRDFSTGQRTVYQDSATLSNHAGYTLAEQLALGSALTIRNYGANGLSTIALQGSSDVHSAVIWNGFNLQSLMSGSADLSQVPAFFTEETGIQTGSASSLWGSGAVGGSVLLNNKPDFRKGIRLKANTEAGSYGLFRQQLKAGFSTGNWYANVRTFYAEAANNYPLPGNATMAHAANWQKGVLAENYLRWKNNFLAIRGWWQDNYRQIPRTEDEGDLHHNSRRANVEYQKTLPKLRLISRSAWLREEIRYLAPVRTMRTHQLADAFISEAEINWTPRLVHHVNAGIHLNHQQAFVKEFNYGPTAILRTKGEDTYEKGVPVRQLLGLFAQYKYLSLNSKLSAQLSVRQDLVWQTAIPLVPAAGLEWKTRRWLAFKGNISRFFRLPTFNELYWTPGGNPLLLPEQGWNAELSARVSKTGTRTEVFYELAAFNRRIYNWIRWVPDGSYWSAKNVAEVWTRGLEHRAGATYKTRYGSWKATAHTTYFLSTNQFSSLEEDRSIGLQIIFMPLYQANALLSYALKGWYVQYNHAYTGYTYTSSDHSQWLLPFHVGNAVLSYSIPCKKAQLSAVFRINNLWDASYRTVAAYPMPPRHFQAGITIDFFQPTKTRTL